MTCSLLRSLDRGGGHLYVAGLVVTTPYYARSANRAGAPPSFPPLTVEEMAARLAPALGSALAPAPAGPAPLRPWFRKRFVLPTPPENTAPAEMVANRALGLPRAMRRHHPSPGFEVASNGGSQARRGTLTMTFRPRPGRSPGTGVHAGAAP